MSEKFTFRDHVVKTIQSKRFHYSDEKTLQDGIERALSAAEIPFTREAPLGEHGIIDFLLDGGVGLEVKIKGSPTEVARQLIRYMACTDPTLTEIILVTGRHALGNWRGGFILGRPVTVVSLCWSFL